MTFDVDYALDVLPLLLAGARVTVLAAIAGYAVSLAVGLAIAVLRNSPISVVRHITRLLVDFVRSTPLLVQLFFVYYVMPLHGLTLDALPAGILTLGLHYATYTSEVFRAGIDALPRGQWEASKALGLPRRTTWVQVVLPQTIPPMTPALGNYLVSIFKDTPILATITVSEMLRAALVESSRTFRYFEPLALVGIIFLVLSYVASLGIRLVERRQRRESFAVI